MPTVPLVVFQRLTRTAVVLLALIVVTGGAVRLTDSGLGCPTWPQCGSGSFVTRPAFAYHGWVEFGNRMVTVAVGLVMLGLPLVALRLTPRAARRRDLLLLSFGLWVGFVAQVVLGGLTVLYHLHPALVASHFLLSMLLLVDVVVLDVRARAARGPTGPAAGAELRWLSRLLAAAAAAVLLLGTVVTGSGPHSGDAAHARRFGFAVRDAAQLHADAAMVLVGLVVATVFALRLAGAPAPARRLGDLLAVVVLAQAGLGFAQYFLGIPTLLVGLHIAGATLLWVLTLRLSLALTVRPPAPGHGVASPSTAASPDRARPRLTPAPS